MTFISRRDLLKRAAIVGAVVPGVRGVDLDGRGDGLPPVADGAADAAGAQSGRVREPLENLTAGEMDILDAFVARLIPSDALGPGAAEGRAAHYIDRALGGALASSKSAYVGGLAALDAYAQLSRGAAFSRLSAADQDAVLTAVEGGTATGFTGARQFFAMVLSHTHQGMFGDPYYGGNANFVGWDLLGYPGVRTMVSAADQQQLEKHSLKPNHRSAYDTDMFTKATARHRSARDSSGERA